MTEQHPLVSIVIPCYNHAQFVQETIQSVIDQDYENIELIIIDDGSKDNSVEVIQEMIPACEERFVRFEFRHRLNVGVSATLNEALDWCGGEYFSTIASDDILLSHKISYLIEKILTENTPAVFGGVRCIGDYDYILATSKITKMNFKGLILHRYMPPAPGSLISMRAIKEVNGFNRDVKLEDWYLWLRLTENGKDLIVYPEIVAQYRRHEGNTINNIDFMLNERMRVLDFFSHSNLYRRAKGAVYQVHASGLSKDYACKSLMFLYKSKLINMRTLKVLFKVILYRVKKEFGRK